MERQRANVQRVAIGRIECGATPQNRTHSQQQFSGAERLRQIVICAAFEAGNAIGLFALGSQHDDGHLGLGANHPQHLEAIDAGQHDIENDEVVGVFDCSAGALFTAVDAIEAVAAGRE